MKSKRTSLADIAESLNVSKSTVSFVLNGKGKQFNISETTQKLILEKAKELNYVPNYFAKGLREGKTQTIGLVLADISNPFYSCYYSFLLVKRMKNKINNIAAYKKVVMIKDFF